MQFDFFKGNETEQYMFYRVPQVLFTDEQFKKISCEAKLLYGFLIDRTSLSVKNNWLDKSGNVFVYFTLEEAKEKLNIGTGKSVKIFDELERIGLIIRKKQGQGNPTKIYVMNFTKQISKTSTQVAKDKVQTSKNRNLIILIESYLQNQINLIYQMTPRRKQKRSLKMMDRQI